MFAPQVARAQAVASRLLAAYQAGGIFGARSLPGNLAPPDESAGSEAHLRFVTFTVAIDHMRNAEQLWDAARRTHADPTTRYVFDPARAAHTGLNRLVDDLVRHKLAKKPARDVQTWQAIAATLVRHFDGQVTRLLHRAEWDALRLLWMINSPRYVPGFPYLKGPKTSVLWVRLLHDHCGCKLRLLSQVPLPVDAHTAHATLQTGCVDWDTYRGPMAPLRDAVQTVWREALRDSGHHPLHMAEPLGLLSRNGCRKTRVWPCEYGQWCPVGEWCTPERQVAVAVGAAGEEVRLG